MILNQTGAKYYYNGIIYSIGDKFIVTDNSSYNGLFGVISEIRDGDDRESQDSPVEIYCELLPPMSSGKNPETADTDPDRVKLTPAMIRVFEAEEQLQKVTVYFVREDWVIRGDCGEFSHPTTDYDHARMILQEIVLQEQLDGCASNWAQREDFEVVCDKDSYECWLQGEYCENHYRISIEKVELPIGGKSLAALGKAYIDSKFRQQFAEQVECWEEIVDLDDTQFADLIAQPQVPECIRRALKESGSLIDAYWEAVSEAALHLVKQYIIDHA